MKKRIGKILFLALFVGACFIALKSIQIDKLAKGFNLAQLYTVSQAVAEVNQDGEVEDTIDCTYHVQVCTGWGSTQVCVEYDYSGTRDTCVKGPGSCSPTLCK